MLNYQRVIILSPSVGSVCPPGEISSTDPGCHLGTRCWGVSLGLQVYHPKLFCFMGKPLVWRSPSLRNPRMFWFYFMGWNDCDVPQKVLNDVDFNGIGALRTVWVVLTRFQGDGIPPIPLARARSTTRWRSRRSSTASWEIWNIARSGQGSCHQPHQGFKIERPEIIASEDKNPRISHISSYVHMILYNNLLISSCCLSFGPSYLFLLQWRIQ